MSFASSNISEARQTLVRPRPDTMPDALKALSQWVLWRLEQRNGKFTKVPYHLDEHGQLKKAKADDPTTWMSFEQAQEAYLGTAGLDGLGFMFLTGGNLIGIDLDDMRDPETGALTQEAQDILSSVNTYAEISPSGKGIHAFVVGRLPEGGRRVGKVEMYEQGRYFTMTGHRLEQFPSEPQPRLAEIEALHTRLFPRIAKDSRTWREKVGKKLSFPLEQTVTPDDSTLLEKAKQSKGNFAQLWEGQWEGTYPSQSEADLALCRSLLFWFAGDTRRVFTAFRSSGLYRPKWDEKHSSEGKTYGELTLERALHGWDGKTYTGFSYTQAKTLDAHSPTLQEESSLVLGIYAVRDGRITYKKREKTGDIFISLCNFSARIKAAISKDDGAERIGYFVIEGKLDTGYSLPEIQVSTSEFSALNWVIRLWGAYGAIVNAGQAVKDHIRAAIQQLSQSQGMVRHEVYGHLGWRTIGGNNVYLSAGSIIGATGPLEGVQVEFSGKLKLYALPTPPTRNELTAAIAESLRLLEVAPDTATLPLLALTYRAAISVTRYSVHVYGLSGTAKSGLAAIALQHFAPMVDRFNFTGEWKDTENSLERTLFEAKDALSGFDDFNPVGTAQEVSRWHSKAERVFRAQGNGTGRNRMNAQLRNNAPTPPKGSLLSTGEELPRGYSLQARVFTISLKVGDVKMERLKALSKAGKGGLLAQSMAGFIQWLAPQLEAVRQDLERMAEEYQSLFPASHGRITDAAADLLAGLSIFLRFAEEVGALTHEQAQALLARGIEALSGVSSAQAQYLEQNNPALRFFEVLGSLFSSGAVYAASAKDEGVPLEPEKWGWENTSGGWISRAKTRVGWVTDRGELYLDPDTAFSEVQKRVSTQGSALSRTAQTLWKELAEQGYIYRELSKKDGRTYNTLKREINGKRPRVLHVQASTLQSLWALWADSENTVSDEGEIETVCGHAHIEFVGAARSTPLPVVPSSSAHIAPVGTPTTLDDENPLLNSAFRSCPQSPQQIHPIDPPEHVEVF